MWFLSPVQKVKDQWSYAERALREEAAVQRMDQASIPNFIPCQSDDEEDGAQTDVFYWNDVLDALLGMAGREVAEK